MLGIDQNIKMIRNQKSFEQKEVAYAADMHTSEYSGTKRVQSVVSYEALNERIKNALYRIMDEILANNKFQTFFEQNISTKKLRICLL